MDCRNSFLLGLSLLAGAAGCVSQPVVPGGSAMNLMGADKNLISRENGKPKPGGEVWVAYGKLCESKAAQLDKDPLRQQNLRDEARKSYQGAIEVEPAGKGGYLALAEFYMMNEDSERALETCRKGLKKLPKEPALWSAEGICQCRKKDWAAAVVAFRKAHELEPEDRGYGTELGLCLARAGRVDESVACLTQVQGQSRAHYTVARMLERVGQPELSKQHLRQALQLKPDLQPAEEMLARLEGRTPAEAGGLVQIGFKEPAP